jgi:hypothetical protein
MPKITLASIAESIDAKFGAFEVELSDGSVVELLNPTRLSPESRRAMIELSSAETDETDADELTIEQRIAAQEESIGRMAGIVRIAAATPAQADALLAACSPRGYLDVAIVSEVVTEYLGAERVGEASASQD